MPKLSLYFLIFTVSGFSGLIYESIWTHYLKLFLGHAAYAQTLVLAIFMGGMAIGAWLCGRLSTGWRNLLWGYALVEGVIGLLALLFHVIFTGVTASVMDTVLPAAGPDWSTAIKWAVGTLLILPQSILLGMTFPLMTAGVIRRHPERAGATIATLYFVNSLGGALGVLASGFWLIDTLGLPGTIALAGVINLLLATLVAHLSRKGVEQPLTQAVADRQRDPTLLRPLLLLASLTGLSSFIYEVGWIRMLSLVLGSSTHSFELMLSAFIFGLALGGFWIRKRLDRIAAPVDFLAWVQIVMGGCALATLPLYHGTFDLMQWLMGAASKTTLGYLQYSVVSHGIAMLIMLPAAVCAGMTLPLATHALMRAGHGERAIGQVYGANTVGAILGVVFAVHWGLPALGLKHLIVFGAAIDIVLGLWLLYRLGGGSPRFIKAAAGSAVMVVAFAGLGSFDPLRLASGVFRAGQQIMTQDNAQVSFYRDGKTASISVIEKPDGIREIRTNGKADASINMNPTGAYQLDEVTMIMTGALPLLLKPEAQKVANIGMGSGLTSHVLLSHPPVQRVDTIEIEKEMIEGARHFLPVNRLTFEDPRGHIVIEDAKSYFSSHQQTYDVIVSEPSNPWVSGVSSLFSLEFHAHVKKHLARNGLMVQWLKVYEIEESLVASIIKSVDATFADYMIFAANFGDLLIVATPEGRLPALPTHLPATPLAQELQRIGIQTPHDLYAHLVGTRRSLRPWLQSHATPANSDYAPVLDQRAGRARFMGRNAGKLALLQAVGRRDAAAMATQGNRLLEQRQDSSAAQRKYLLAATLLGLVGSNQQPQALALWQRLGKETFPTEVPFLFRLLAAHAAHGETR